MPVGLGTSMTGYLSLFAVAFLAATILPMQSEALLVGLMIHGQHGALALLAVATVGNVLGSVVNWGLGHAVLRFQHRRWFPASPSQMARAEMWYARYGRWSLLVSWFPVVGDALTVTAGVLREPLWSFVAIVGIGKALRYGGLAWVTLVWIG